MYPFLGVYTAFLLSPFSKFPLWSLDSIVCIFIVRFHRFSVNGRPKRREKFAFSSKSALNRFSVNAALVLKRRRKQPDCLTLRLTKNYM